MARIGKVKGQSPLQKKYNDMQKVKKAYCTKGSKVTKTQVNKATKAYKKSKVDKVVKEAKAKGHSSVYISQLRKAAMKQADATISRILNRPCGVTSKAVKAKKSTGSKKIKQGKAIFTVYKTTGSKASAKRLQGAIQRTGRRSIVRKTKNGYTVYQGPSRKQAVIRHTQQRVAGRR